jgi:hypothetical protein
VRSEKMCSIHLELTRRGVALYTDKDSDHTDGCSVTVSQYSNYGSCALDTLTPHVGHS